LSEDDESECTDPKPAEDQHEWVRMTKACYRYRTAALIGPWRRGRDEAESDAVAAKLAWQDGNALAWRVAGEIEISLCDQGGSCGGIHPPPAIDAAPQESGPESRARLPSPYHLKN
jgi:hypothetical protein